MEPSTPQELLKLDKDDSTFHDVPDFITNIKQEILIDDVSEFTGISRNAKKDSVFTSETPCSSNHILPLVDNIKKETKENDVILDKWNITEYKVDTKRYEICEAMQKEVNSENVFKSSDLIKFEEVNLKYEAEQDSLSSNYIGQEKQDIHQIPDDANTLKCDHCDYQTIQKRNLKAHLVRHRKREEDDMFKCKKCDFKINNKCDLSRHLLNHKIPEEVRRFKCDSCDYRATQKSHLQSHLLRHRNPEEVDRFKCDQCDYQTIQKRLLKAHLLRHRNDQEVDTFECNQCNFKTTRRCYLKKHLLRHKNPDEVDTFKCSQCAFHTGEKSCLKRHLLVHKNREEVETFKCNLCSYQTFRKDGMTIHLLRHQSPEEVLKCDECDFVTTHKYYLKTHLRLRHRSTEEGDMLKCDQCDFQTTSRLGLRRHVLHHGKSQL